MTGVSVDEDFVRFGSKSYAINKINSIEVREQQPHGRAGAYIMGGIAALVLMSWLGSFASPAGQSPGLVVVAAIAAALAYRSWERSKRREYQLFLMTSSSEAQAFVTRDAGEIEDLRGRIEQAMLAQSRAGRSVVAAG